LTHLVEKLAGLHCQVCVISCACRHYWYTAHRFSVPVQEDEDGDDEGYDEDMVTKVHVQDQTHQEYDDPQLSPTSFNGYSHASVCDDVSPRAPSSKSIIIKSEASVDVHPIRINSLPFPAIPLSRVVRYAYFLAPCLQQNRQTQLDSGFFLLFLQQHAEGSSLNIKVWEDQSVTPNELAAKRSISAHSTSAHAICLCFHFNTFVTPTLAL
jgi:hypothetical protein